ncbi:MAG: TolC family protein [Bacteroidales bacterium]
MKRIKLLVSFALLPVVGFGENIETVMQSVEKNNLILKSYYQTKIADQRAEKASNNLMNPDVEASYQWGKPGSIGNKQTLTATQSFDFPASYYYRTKATDHRIKQRDAIFQQERISILLQTQNLCIEIIYLNQLVNEYQQRLEHAGQLFKSVQRQFDAGGVSILDLNKSRLNLMNAQSDYDQAKAGKEGKQLALTQMNGGISIDLSQDHFPVPSVPLDFNSWYETTTGINPDLIAAQQESEATRRDLSLSKSNGLPKLTVGYTMEHLADELFQGAVFGVSLPLWENRNQVKQAKARMFAAEYQLQSKIIAQKAQYEELYKQLVQLDQNCKLYNETLLSMSNDALLLKAYQKGELSLLEYLIELSYYYDTKTKALELNRNVNMIYNEFMQLSL